MSNICPHCSSNIQPAPDGTCLVCCKNVNFTDGGEESYGMVMIIAAQNLPYVCLICGDATTNRESLNLTRGGAADKPPVRISIFFVFGLIGFLFHCFMRELLKRPDQIVEIPVCEQCVQQKKSIPKPMDQSPGKFKILAHNKFISGLR